MGKIHKIKDNGSVVYPVTVADAVVVSGSTLQSLQTLMNEVCLFTTVKTDVSDPQDGGNASSAEITALNAKVANLITSATSLNTKVANLTTSATSLNSRVSAIEGGHLNGVGIDIVYEA